MVLFIHWVRVCVCVSYVRRRRRLSFLSVEYASCLVLMVLTSLTAEGSEDREHLVLTSCVRWLVVCGCHWCWQSGRQELSSRLVPHYPRCLWCEPTTRGNYFSHTKQANVCGCTAYIDLAIRIGVLGTVRIVCSVLLSASFSTEQTSTYRSSTVTNRIVLTLYTMHIHKQTLTDSHTRVHGHTYGQTPTETHAHTHTCRHTNTETYKYFYSNTHTHSHTHINMCTDINTHTNTHDTIICCSECFNKEEERQKINAFKTNKMFWNTISFKQIL